MSKPLMRPINKQAAIFLHKTDRVETIQMALEVMATAICGKNVAEEIASMIAMNKSGEDVDMKITMVIRRDPRTADQYSVNFRTSLNKAVSDMAFYGLTRESRKERHE